MRRTPIVRTNLRYAQKLWGKLPPLVLRGLAELAERHRFSILAGDLQLLDGRWYVTHAGLLRLATRSRCSGMRTELLAGFCDPSASRWVFKATVYKSPKSRGFVGFGDADPANVSLQMHGAEMRIAETRAVNRALRKAYGIGICSVEELGCQTPVSSPRISNQNGKQVEKSANRQPAVRDRLCQLIKRYELDPTLVKQYAIEFCETENLRDAQRERIEEFVEHLGKQAATDRAALLCQLNSFAQETHA